MLMIYQYRAIMIIITAVLSLSGNAFAETQSPDDVKPLPGLTVNDQGQLLKDGKPLRAIGMNYFSAFYRTLLKEGDRSYEQGFKTLSEHNIPFVRFMANGFWPNDCKLYLEDKGAYFRKLDAVVKAAEKNNIGLVPSLYWHYAAVPDLVGEPINQLGNRNSKTHKLMRQYTREVVTRYRNSSAIWMWEFGNEYNLPADLPNAAKFRPKVNAKSGTPGERTERDDITHEMLTVAFEEFAATVRKYDPHRPIVSGCSVPRVYAWHNWKEGTWDKDTREQFYEIMIKENPAVFDVISVHLYPRKGKQYFADGLVDMPELVEAIAQMAMRAGRPLFIGEFGAPVELGPEQERARFIELLSAIEKSRVPLAAGWVFDLPFQEGQWNITADNERVYMLELIGEANRRIND